MNTVQNIDSQFLFLSCPCLECVEGLRRLETSFEFAEPKDFGRKPKEVPQKTKMFKDVPQKTKDSL